MRRCLLTLVAMSVVLAGCSLIFTYPDFHPVDDVGVAAGDVVDTGVRPDVPPTVDVPADTAHADLGTLDVEADAAGDDVAFPIDGGRSDVEIFVDVPQDAAVADVTAMDTGVADTGMVDARVIDTGTVDAGRMDTGPVDTGVHDTGVDVGCATGQTLCGSTCVNLRADTSNCGSCGSVCSFMRATAACASGICVLSGCTAGYGNCDGMAANGCETNLLVSPSSCGVCGAGCGSLGVCTGGSCTCPAGMTFCQGQCRDTTTDPANCGACGVRCSDAVCTSGVCMTCGGGGFGVACDGVCTVLGGNMACSGCGNVCAAGQECISGTCRTPVGDCLSLGDLCIPGSTGSGCCGAQNCSANPTGFHCCIPTGQACTDASTCCPGSDIDSNPDIAASCVGGFCCHNHGSSCGISSECCSGDCRLGFCE